VDRVHVSLDRPGMLGPSWTDAGADNGHGGALIRARPPGALVRQSSPGGGAKLRGGHGELIYGLTGARAALRRAGDDGGGSVVSALGEREVRARREGNESGERCGEAQRCCSPFIGVGGAPGSKCRWVTAGDLRPTPLMAGEGVNGDSGGGIKVGE
jgi:hypothetical protein